MAQTFLDDLGRTVRGGLVGKIGRGLSAGGIAFGYRVDHAKNDTSIRGGSGHLLIDQDEAAIVERVFRDYAAGKSPKAIAEA